MQSQFKKYTSPPQGAIIYSWGLTRFQSTQTKKNIEIISWIRNKIDLLQRGKPKIGDRVSTCPPALWRLISWRPFQTQSLLLWHVKSSSSRSHAYVFPHLVLDKTLQGSCLWRHLEARMVSRYEMKPSSWRTHPVACRSKLSRFQNCCRYMNSSITKSMA